MPTLRFENICIPQNVYLPHLNIDCYKEEHNEGQAGQRDAAPLRTVGVHHTEPAEARECGGALRLHRVTSRVRPPARVLQRCSIL
jgi:hypothetical protein